MRAVEPERGALSLVEWGGWGGGGREGVAGGAWGRRRSCHIGQCVQMSENMLCVVVQIYDATEPYEMQQAAGVAPTVLTLGKLGYAQVKQPSSTYTINVYLYILYISIPILTMGICKSQESTIG